MRRRFVMEIRIQDVHFDATEALKSFIQKKVSKLDQYYDGILAAEISLKVIKPETATNKEAQIRLVIPGQDLFASKTSDTFEEAVDSVVEALEKQLVRFKEKMRTK